VTFDFAAIGIEICLHRLVFLLLGRWASRPRAGRAGSRLGGANDEGRSGGDQTHVTNHEAHSGNDRNAVICTAIGEYGAKLCATFLIRPTAIIEITVSRNRSSENHVALHHFEARVSATGDARGLLRTPELLLTDVGEAFLQVEAVAVAALRASGACPTSGDRTRSASTREL